MFRYALPLLLVSPLVAAQQADPYAWSEDGQVVDVQQYNTIPTHPEDGDASESPGRWYVNDQGDRVFVTWGQGTLPNLEDYRQPFEALDTDGDGRLFKDELPTGHALRYEWKLVDRNGDGVITAQEFRRWR